MPELFGFEEPEGFDSADENQRGEAKKTSAKGSRFIPPGPWDEFPDLWDKLTTNGQEWPGLATVEVSRANKWDTKKSKGEHGGKRGYAGADLAKVRIKIRVWEADHFDDLLNKYMAIVEPDPGKEKPDVITIGHQVATLRKVKQVTIDKVSGPDVTDGMGEIEIEATEHREPDDKNATGTAKASGNGSKGNGAQGNNDSRCQQLASEYRELQAKNASLQQGLIQNDQSYYMGMSPGGRADFDEAKENRRQSLQNDQRRNEQRMSDIRDEQQRLGCSGDTQPKPSSQDSVAGPDL